MDEEGVGDRWLIGDLRDRSQAPNVDHFLVGPETVAPIRDAREMELERLRRRVGELERHMGEAAKPAVSITTGYTLFFPWSGGYEVLDGDGALPAVGALLVVRGEQFVVDAVRRSPFPSDSRPCLVLSPHGSTHTSDGASTGG